MKPRCSSYFAHILLVCYLFLLRHYLYVLHSWCGAPTVSLYMYNDNSILFKIQTVSYCQLVMQKLYKGFYPWF